MTTSVLDRPLDCTADDLDEDEDGLTHIICCNEYEALCGEDVSDGAWVSQETATLPTCIDCEAIEEGLVAWVCPWCRKSNREGVFG